MRTRRRAKSEERRARSGTRRSRSTHDASHITSHGTRFTENGLVAPKSDEGGTRFAAFTMIEIAICLAVIGFALAAIIGVLPLGMNVQRENREETVVNQDASVFVNAIRNGELGLDDLTNAVVAITNTWAVYRDQYPQGPPVQRGPLHVSSYTYTNSRLDGAPLANYLPMTNGFGIIGLLSTPKYVPFTNGNTLFFRSNYIVANVRSISGDASEKFPQTNASMRDLAFSYRLISEVVPYAGFDRSWTNWNNDASIIGNTNEITTRSNYWMVAKNLQNNLHDLRLIFRFPLLPNGKIGNGRLVFRTTASGLLSQTNAPGFVNANAEY